MLGVLPDRGDQFSTMKGFRENRSNEIEEQFQSIEERIKIWDKDQTILWGLHPEEASEYLQAVTELQRLNETIQTMPSRGDREAISLVSRVQSVLQIAMAKLEDSFSQLLINNSLQMSPENLSFLGKSTEEDDDDSISNEGDISPDHTQVVVRRESIRESNRYITDLVHSDAILDLRNIFNVMFLSNYDQECCQAFVINRQDALNDCLYVLEAERLSIEDVMKIKWDILDGKFLRWVEIMKFFIRVYLASEKHLCDQIFGEQQSISQKCFIEITKASMFQLLNFGEAIAISPREPEKLIRLVDMYGVLEKLLPDIDSIFSSDLGSPITAECRLLLKSLCDAIRGTFSEFGNKIRTYVSQAPFAGGSTHHMTKYVMNYVKALAKYRGILDSVLQGYEGEDNLLTPFSDLELVENREDGDGSSPLGRCLRSLISLLECNLQESCNLYKDAALQHFFMMNNIYYIAQKVKTSELKDIFGDHWIRTHMKDYANHAWKYERISWSALFALLTDDGLNNVNSNSSSSSNSLSKTILKERFRNFNLMFEEIYKVQTGWFIPASQLRDELRISVSLKLLPAYRRFKGKHSSQMERSRHRDRYIKYSEEDLENYLEDLFKGSQKSIHYSFRR